MNKNNTPIVIVGSIIIALLAYIAFKPKVMPVVYTVEQTSPISQQQTIPSNQPVTPPAKKPTNIAPSSTPLVAASSNPYPPSYIAGGLAYLLLKNQITANGTAVVYTIYPSNKGQYADANGTIYYYPQSQNKVIQFGANVTDKGTVTDFIRVANEKITKNGYVIVSVFVDGGSMNEWYSVVQ
jgi:hypothetical protein